MNNFIIALLSVALVVLIGWIAGRFNIIDKNLDNGFNIFILKFSLPILLFYTAATANLKQLFDPRMNGAFAVGLIGMFILTFLFHKLILKRDLHISAESAFVCAYPNSAFLGIPLMTSIVGMSAMIPIVVSNIIVGVFVIPATLIMIEIGLFGSEKVNFRHIILKIIQTPLISMSLLGMLFAICSIKLPSVIDHTCKMLGGTAPGISLFALGLIMSRFKIRLSKLASLNIFCKIIIHPLMMVGIVKLFGITGILAKELIVLCALPTAISSTIFSVTFNIEPEENVSSTILGTIFSVITIFIFMWWLKL